MDLRFLFLLSQNETPITKRTFHCIAQPTYGCYGKHNGPVSWRRPNKSPLGSLCKVFRSNNRLWNYTNFLKEAWMSFHRGLSIRVRQLTRPLRFPEHPQVGCMTPWNFHFLTGRSNFEKPKIVPTLLKNLMFFNEFYFYILKGREPRSSHCPENVLPHPNKHCTPCTIYTTHFVQYTLHTLYNTHDTPCAIRTAHLVQYTLHTLYNTHCTPCTTKYSW